MGGGGSYYDRDVTSGSRRLAAGFSDVAEERLSRSNVNPAVLPKNRRLISNCKSPIVSGFDGTGSMGTLPKIGWDKWPMVVGQLSLNSYLDDPMISVAVIGDVLSDNAPIQIGDFSNPRKLDDWLERMWLEGMGGGQRAESYEFTAYFYARLYEMRSAVTPVFIFTGDEGFREKLYAAELREHFGGEHQGVNARTIFEELKKKFLGNVFLIHPTHCHYGRDADKRIVAQWTEILGEECIIHLKDNLAIADTTLGILALAGGSRTLDGYIEDVRNRPLDLGGEKFEPQSEKRIEQIRASLELLASTRQGAGKKDSKKPDKAKKESETPVETPKDKPKKKKDKPSWKV